MSIVKDYVHYKLHFPDEFDHDHSVCQPLLGSLHLQNKTAALFDEAIDMCPAKAYSPRVLSSSQISFKRTDDESVNAKSSMLPNETNSSLGDSNMDSKKDVIHEYLAIALVLPQHPFSRALIDSMRIVAPMYPQVVVFFGIATEFQSLCSQYGVRSFPKLLLFHKGLLVDKHTNVNGEKYKPAKLAKRFSRWTNSLPRSNPVPPMLKIKQANEELISLQNITAFVDVLKDWLEAAFIAPFSLTNASRSDGAPRLNFGDSVEPVVSLSEHPKQMDVLIYVLCMIYVFSRMLFFSWP